MLYVILVMRGLNLITFNWFEHNCTNYLINKIILFNSLSLTCALRAHVSMTLLTKTTYKKPIQLSRELRSIGKTLHYICRRLRFEFRSSNLSMLKVEFIRCLKKNQYSQNKNKKMLTKHTTTSSYQLCWLLNYFFFTALILLPGNFLTKVMYVFSFT
jgi:hypothetical protein